MIDWNKPVQTKSGCPVRIWVTDAKCSHVYVVRGEWQRCSDEWKAGSWTISGRILEGDEKEYDLENVPEKIVQYVNFYPNYTISRNEADTTSRDGRIACVRVEFKEGQFDD